MRKVKSVSIFAALVCAAMLASSSICDAGKVNINTASKRKLQKLPGVGENLAALIVDYRRNVGLFDSVSELKEVHGIGEKKLRALKYEVTVGALAEKQL